MLAHAVPSRLPAALVFDLDGTIVNTEFADFESIRAVWAEHGAGYTLEQYEHCIGTAEGVGDWIDELSEVIGQHVDRGRAEQRRRGVLLELLADLTAREGIVELLEHASTAGVPMAIASNSPRYWVEARLAALGLDRHFDVLMTIDEAPYPKPHPAPFARACAALGADPAESVAFEDSVTGVTSAVAAGLYTIACPHPLTANHDLSSAHRIVASHAELVLTDLRLDARSTAS